MNTNTFMPEGMLSKTDDYKTLAAKYTADIDALRKAMNDKIILEARCLKCTADYNLIVKINNIECIIYHEDGAIGISEKTTKDSALVTRVGKNIQFIVKDFETDDNGNTRPVLSRRDAQLMFLENFVKNAKPGDVIKAHVTHCDPYGAFVDIGAGVNSLLPLSNIAIARTEHAKHRFKIDSDIFVVITDINPETNKISVSHKELLGTWAENAAHFNVDDIVIGTVHNIKDYGVFIEVAPNFVGLANNTSLPVKSNDRVSVHIRDIIHDTMKVKLEIIDITDSTEPEPVDFKYYINSGHIDHWRYSNDNAAKIIETKFGS